MAAISINTILAVSQQRNRDMIFEGLAILWSNICFLN
jgi:hypothetical protein